MLHRSTATLGDANQSGLCRMFVLEIVQALIEEFFGEIDKVRAGK